MVGVRKGIRTVPKFEILKCDTFSSISLFLSYHPACATTGQVLWILLSKVIRTDEVDYLVFMVYKQLKSQLLPGWDASSS